MSNIVNDYKQVHENMKRKYFNKKVLTQEKNNAKLLQDFLVNMKRVSLGRDLKLTAMDKIAFQELMQQMEKEFQQLSPKNAKLSKMLFRSSGVGFEKDIVKLHQMAENALALEANKKMTKEEIHIGNISANILNTSETIDISPVVIDAVNQASNEALDELVGANFHKGIVVKGRSGKIDVRGNKMVQVNYYSKNVPKKIMQLLASSNFTLKSKKSMTWDNANKKLVIMKESDIHLGHTTPYVAIMGALSLLEKQLSLQERERIFYQGLIENVKYGNKEIGYHLNHLQFIYELSGAGQFYSNGLGDIGVADYLIYNDPDSDDIQVRSVNAMIAEVLEEKNSIYSAGASFIRKNVAVNKMTKMAKKNFSRYQ